MTFTLFLIFLGLFEIFLTYIMLIIMGKIKILQSEKEITKNYIFGTVTSQLTSLIIS